VDFDAAFCGSEPGPLENTETQIDSGGIKCIDIALKIEDVGDSLPSRFVNHVVGEVLKNAAVPILVSLGQVASGNVLPHSEVVAFAAMGFQGYNQVAQALAIGELAEHQGKHLVPASEELHILVASVFADEVVEVVPVEEPGQLGENVFVNVHLPKVSAKVKFKSVDSENLCNLLIYSNFKELY